MRNGERIMKNTKYGILLSAALAAMMLFAACDKITDTPENYAQIEEGYGRVSVSFTGDFAAQKAGRTILPSTSAFDKYEYLLTAKGILLWSLAFIQSR